MSSATSWSPGRKGGLYIFMHGQPPPAASGSSGASPSSGCGDLLRKQLLEDEPALQIVRHGVDCESLAGQRPLAPGARSWGSTLELAHRAARYHREVSRDVVVQAAGLLGDGDEESYASTLLESSRDLGSQELVEESSRDA